MDMAKAAKESNCSYFVVGVESFKQEKLDRMNKKIKVQQILDTLDLLHKYDIDYHGNVLLGFEGETYEDIHSEVSSIPEKYKVFPMLVQPFIGTKNGFTRSISEDESTYLSSLFVGYVEAENKYCYAEVL